MYPILYRLEDDGLVLSEWTEPKEKQVPRKYYKITDKGLNELKEIKETWMKISSGVNKILGDVQ